MKLLNAIKIQLGCILNSEPKTLSAENKKRLAKLVEERVPSGLAPIEEWNEVLKVIVNAPPEHDNEKAKQKLLTLLLIDANEKEN